MISTRGRYAIRVMIDLAQNAQERFVPLKEIAERQGISKKYLEIIVRDMTAGGLIVGSSGKGGGYRLCRKPEAYTLDEILELMEGTLSPVACLAEDRNHCPRQTTCQTLPLWTEFNQVIHDFFHSKKLSDLISQPQQKAEQPDGSLKRFLL